jgi:hypothetical protein
MTCRRLSGAIVCGRDSRGRRANRYDERPDCRVPGCPRYATEASWGCRPHWYRLPPDLRHRLFLADRDDQTGQAWLATAEEADRWIADHPEGAPKRDRRQRELLL